jgi:glycosyltransferase involved in cell wall biosynthesis
VIVVYNALSVRPGVADGAATFSVNMVAELSSALDGDEVVVLVRQGETRFEGGGNRVVHVSLPGIPFVRVVWEWFALSRILSRLRAGVFVSPNESLPLRMNCPCVVVAQNLAYHWDGWQSTHRGGGVWERLASRAQAAYYRRAMPRAYRRATTVVAVSETTACVLAEGAGLDRAKTTVVLEGSDSRLLPEPSRSSQREPRLLVVSALAPYKGLERSLRLFARVRKERPDLDLDLVGADWRGFRERLVALAAELGITGHVHFLGNLRPAELAAAYERSLALLHLSESESFGLSVAEAMRNRLPVISSGRSSLPEITQGAAVELADDLDAAARQLTDFFADDERRDEVARRGCRRAEELTWRHAGEAFARVVAAAGNRNQALS